MEKVILHIDFDSFFASCEQQFTPSLRGIPVGVTATNGRSAIIAASREAKKRGVKSPSRTFEAEQVCPEIVFVGAHFQKYWEVSKKFLTICLSFSPYVELFSLDEVFMDVTLTACLFGGVSALVCQLKKRIKSEIGEYITVSVGISYNKLLAKLGSGMNKPDGIMEITKENLLDVYSVCSLTAMCGIGERIKLRLHKIGIYTLLQLSHAPLCRLIGEFGNVEGQFLHAVGQGIDSSSLTLVSQAPQAKSIGRNYCLPHNEYSQRVILQNVYELCEEVAIKLRRLDKKAKTTGLSLRGTQAMYGTITADYTSSGQQLFEHCKSLYDKWKWGATLREGMVRQMSIWVSNLEDAARLTLPLFPQALRNHNLLRTIDHLNEKYGDHTVRRGYLLYADKLTTAPNGWMADRYERTVLARSLGA